MFYNKLTNKYLQEINKYYQFYTLLIFNLIHWYLN